MKHLKLYQSYLALYNDSPHMTEYPNIAYVETDNSGEGTKGVYITPQKAMYLITDLSVTEGRFFIATNSWNEFIENAYYISPSGYSHVNINEEGVVDAEDRKEGLYCLELKENTSPYFYVTEGGIDFNFSPSGIFLHKEIVESLTSISFANTANGNSTQTLKEISMYGDPSNITDFGDFTENVQDDVYFFYDDRYDYSKIIEAIQNAGLNWQINPMGLKED